jgi:NAD(P)-dependent dehydrogenase (short-subunit alcohol dehydrogenase family)
VKKNEGMTDPAEPIVLITGATDGVGKVVATRLAASNARVLVHGRSDEKGADTLRDIRREAGHSRLEYYRADFASLDEVRRMAHDVTAAHDRLNLLINNAGIGFGTPGAGRETSRDGYELRFAVNYLAPFLLTHLLLATLRRSVPARIVNVASLGQYRIDFDDVMLTRGYDGTRAYRQSKLALVMFTFDLAALLEGTGVTANAIHPATFMNTRMVTEARIQPRHTVEDGADAILHLATASELEGTSGAFFDGMHESRADPEAYQARARQRLRTLSLELAGVSADVAR